MKRLIISCGMLAEELEKVCKGKEKLPEIIELERGMHNNPKQLSKLLQELIDSHQNVEEIILTYGLCGYGTVGISSKSTRLVIPKFDDCISQLLYQDQNGRVNRSEIKKGHLYLTKGWTKDRESILGQCKNILESYGEEGREIIREIYGGYEKISIIDTGAYDTKEVLAYAEKIKEYLEVQIACVKGSTDILEKIISGNYDDNFIILNPGEITEEKMFRFNGR